jgi:uncharacterized Tic20 family protein
MQPNTWAMLCHLGGLCGYAANGVASVIVPLLIWVIKKDEMPIVDEHGKESLNFNISVMIYAGLLVGLTFVTFGLAAPLTVPLLFVLAAFHVICTVIAAIKANEGKFFRYPFSMRLVR